MYLPLYKKVKNRFWSVLILIMILGFGFAHISKSQVLTETDDVQVEGKVNYDVMIRAFPEKRIPQTGNWINQSTVEIRYPGFTNALTTQVVQHDANGYAHLAPVDSAVITPGTYDISIKGYSHLRKVYSGNTFGQNTLTFDLTSPELLAGDTSVMEDNYINSLDFSYSIGKLYTGNIKSDLNRDGLVNSLDIGNIITNIYKSGDQ